MIRDEKFWSNYCNLIFTDAGESVEVFIPNDLFKIINQLEISGKQKAFAFSLYVLSKISITKGYWYTISEIKELFGYSKKNKSLDKLIKKNGILDEIGLTKTVIKGLDRIDGSNIGVKSTKIQYKEVVYGADIKSNFFKVYIEVMFGCLLKNKELGIIGFYIYSFLCLQCQINHKKIDGNYHWCRVPYSYISTGTGISETEVKSVIEKLKFYEFVQTKRNSVGKKDRYSALDANSYLVNKVCKEEHFGNLALFKVKVISINNKFQDNKPKFTDNVETNMVPSHHGCIQDKEGLRQMRERMEELRLERLRKSEKV